MKRIPLPALLTILSLLGTCLIFSPLPLPAAEGGDPPARPAPQPPGAMGMKRGGQQPSVIRSMPNGMFQLGKIMINKRMGVLSLPGTVNIQDGAVTRFACGPIGDPTKCLLKLDAPPADLHLALIFFDIDPAAPAPEEGKPASPGEGVEIFVTWPSSEKKMIKYRAEELLLSLKTSSLLPKSAWTFTGSTYKEGRLLATDTNTIATMIPEPSTLLVYSLFSAATATEDGYQANSTILPPKGSPIHITILPLDKKKRKGPPPPVPKPVTKAE